MLSGKLPTGTVDDRRDGGGSAAKRGRDRAAGRTATGGTATGGTATGGTATGGTATGGTATGGTAGRDAMRAERTSRGEPGGSTEAARRGGDCATLRRRLERELASERARRRAVIARYERLLTERREGENAEERDADGARRVAATVRRALTRLRLRLPSPPGRSRSRRG